MIVERLEAALDADRVATDPAILAVYSHDYGHVSAPATPLAVVFAETVGDVQSTVRIAAELGVSVIARGAGTGVSGGVHATENCIVLSLERMDRILDIRPEDEVAVVQPGVVNGALNDAVAGHGLMYAPDPASYRQSTIGGNVATNAGGLRCAKYGVTRESVLGLEVVLANGTLIRTGRNTFKGVAGYDLTGLFVGSEGTLGIVVSVTVRLRYLSEQQRSIAALFPDVDAAAAGVLAIARHRVQPAITEMLDAGTMAVIDTVHGTDLASRGGALLLVRTDGHGALIEEELIRGALAELGAELSAPGDGFAARLIEMRRNSRGDEQDDAYRVGEDVAVPRSQLVGYIKELRRIAERHQVLLRVVAHAGDGNLHPTFWVDPVEGEAGIGRLDDALDASIRAALAAGGTITGEHGVGQYKRRWLGWEQQPEVMELQRRVKELFDPLGILNPGKAI
ncbi:FAD-binding oxidoreductase [Zafaria sp. Z1313]|uniref:FAD-binding oxidoreductase n=1 Tax=unclassified Zafaria TaxID=2828765 RepID=UPI002E75AB36|nr:FAD-linked oxidase C-terminal domain-containing protein [Zafaria sp. J156]MEE1622414.1 FAD-linked oxidase C-terminal domain-containing protein [Zafaria sp. J156]